MGNNMGKIDRSLPWLYLAFGLPLLLAWMIVTPPFQVPDEPNHFLRTALVADPGARAAVGPGGAGGSVASGLIKLTQDGRFIGLAFHPESKLERQVFLAGDYWNEGVGNTRVFGAFSNMAGYPAVNYAFPAVGLALSQWLDGRALPSFYAGRASGVVLAVLLAFFALRHISRGRTWCLVLLAMPMSLTLTASYSQDAALIVYTLAAIAMANRYLDMEKTWRASLPLAAVALLLLPVVLGRPPYLPMLALPLLLAAHRRDRLLAGVLLAATLVVLGFWIKAMDQGFVCPLPGIDPVRQKQFVLDHPPQFLWTLASTLITNAPGYAESFVGKLGWLDTPLPWIIPVGFLLLLLLIFRRGQDQDSGRLRLGLLGVIAGILLLIAVAEYLYWTRVGENDIWGIQGRYFIPPALLMSLMMRRDDHTISFLAKAALPMVLLADLLALNILVQRYWL